MNGFVLEVLDGTGWHRYPKVHWTEDAARKVAEAALRKAQRVRIMPIRIQAKPLCELAGKIPA